MRTFLSLFLVLSASAIRADEPRTGGLEPLADRPVLSKEFDGPGMLYRDTRDRIRAGNLKDLETWRKIETKEQWETFRDERIAALRKSLGEFPEPPKKLNVRVTGTIMGDGYRIENTLFESRPGVWVTANVYQPAKPDRSMPGILVIHSHHNPKHEGELQDMGVLWARAGCCVLVMDQFGHGERRQHRFDGTPFPDSTANPGSKPIEYRAGRQDYWFRYNLGLQLASIGESLIGWMAWDQMRAVDLLLAKPGVDPHRIILLGAVAGGGDPAAVTAALDPRIKCLVPFNFGGPQPETRPLGEDAETAFNYAGGGSWESTRNLRDSVRDDFLPWLIVASIAPRHLIHAHEFAWNGERDPVYQRYLKIWNFYEAKDRVAVTHGFGTLTSKDPVGSHCNNIGVVHRKMIHPALEKWFGIKVVESRDRHTAAELRCATDGGREKPGDAGKAMTELGDRKQQATIGPWLALPFEKARPEVEKRWKAVLGVEPVGGLVKAIDRGAEKLGGTTARRVELQVERDIRVPLLLLLPAKPKGKLPVVVAFAQEGKAGFLKNRPEAIQGLLDRGVAVCLPDLRGTGETRPGTGRGRASSASSLSASEQMLGSTVLGQQVRDLSAVLTYLRGRDEIDSKAVALWGESFAGCYAPASSGKGDEQPSDPDLIQGGGEHPYDAAGFPSIGEPGAGTVAVLASFFQPEVKVVLGRGTWLSASLAGRAIYIPHDAVLPGVIAAGDLQVPYMYANPSVLRVERPINARNQALTASQIETLLNRVVRKHWLAAGPNRVDGDFERRFQTAGRYSKNADVAKWLEESLRSQ